MADAKDILGIGKGERGGGGERERASKKGGREGFARKPDGVSREVYALTGGLPPSMPTSHVAKGKGKMTSAHTITWRLLPFTNSARQDDLHLQHWVRVKDGATPSEDYAFAKYNKGVDMVRYSEEEYAQLLQNPKWSQEETDHLFDLCFRFDLRFVVIADRFSVEGPFPERSVEDLKDRYYSVARALLLSREGPNPSLFRDSYNAAHESERKRALALLLSQSRHQDQEELEILAEAKRITEARKAAQVAASKSVLQKVSQKKTTAGATGESHVARGGREGEATEDNIVPQGPRPPRVYVRGVRLAQTVEKAANTAGARLAKRIEQTLEELRIRPKPEVASRAVCAEYIALRKEVVALLNLQKRVQWKQNEVTTLRTAPQGDITPQGGGKRVSRGSVESERMATRAALASGDSEGPVERPPKRETGRKASQTGQSGNVTHQQRRPRKMKNNED